MTIIWCMVPEMFSATDQILCYFGPFFALLPSLKTKKSKFWKNEKKHLEISSFYMCVPKIMIRWCIISEICCTTDRQMDRQTGGQKKWHIEVGAPPKKKYILYSLILTKPKGIMPFCNIFTSQGIFSLSTTFWLFWVH